MKVTLLKDVSGLGLIGDEVMVKDGYALNLLIPKKLATLAGSELAKNVIQAKQTANKNSQKHIEKLKLLAEELKDREFTSSVKVGGNKQMYGSITKNDIATLVKVDKNSIKIDKPIKELGSHLVAIDFGSGVVTTVKLNVVAK